MTASKVTLTDLPLPLQTIILSKVSPTPSALSSIKPSLESVTSIRGKLPQELLSMAIANRTLCEAATEALGPRAQLLNNTTAKPLWKWVCVFEKAVKAVSLYGSEIDEDNFFSLIPLVRPEVVEKICEHALKTFVALSRKDVQLEVLDVKTVPFHKSSYPEILQRKLVNTLEGSASTLRELGLRITPICVNAVSLVTLPNLEVVEMQLNEVEGRDEIITAEKRQCADACMRMLRALNGHADRTANRTTLRELRLLSFSEAPCTEEDDACSGLFQSVRVLKLRSIAYNRCNDGDISKFIALFPNLRNLHWNGAGDAAGFHHIHSKCHALEEMHLRPYIRYTPTADLLEAGEDPQTVSELLASYHGKLRSLGIQARLSPEQLKILGENNPSVEQLAMEIDRGNVAALSSLLGTHCRQIKRLQLSFIPYSVEGLGEEGWQDFTNGIRSASEELCELSITGHLDRHPRETAYDAAVQSMVDIIRFLGNRMRKFCLAVPFDTLDLKVLYEALCSIISACTNYSENISHLVVRIEHADRHVEFEDEEEEKVWSAKLIREIEKLDKLPHLRVLDVGQHDVRAKENLTFTHRL